MTEARSLRLKVASAQQQDVGRGIVRLGQPQIDVMQLSNGDVVEIAGKRTTAALVVPAYPEDIGLDIIRMDGLLRGNAGTSIGESVDIRRADWKEARSISLAPGREGLRIAGEGEALRPTLIHRAVVAGDLISTSAFHRAPEGGSGGGEDLLRRFFETPAYGLMEVRLVVAATSPKGVVRVGPRTQIQLVSEHGAADDRRLIEVTYEDLGGLRHVVQKVREIIELPLKHPELFDRLGIDPPRGVLLHGPPGTGKTLLAKAVAHESEASFFAINGPEILGKHYGESEERLRDVFTQAGESAPSIVFIDEIDSIAPKRAEVTGELERRIVAQLLTLMDGLQGRRNVIVIGATNRVDAIDAALRRPGRFDREIEVRIPDEAGRLEILQIHTRGMPFESDVDLGELAGATQGFTGSDVAALAREAALATLRRLMPILDMEAQSIPPEVLEKLTVTRDDVDQARKEVQPSALREIVSEIPDVAWSRVGGLERVRQRLHEMVELPLQRPEAFTRLGIRPPKGILLYGPPGTGKTLAAKAVATEARANFLVAKGSALLSKWYGESERKIAEFFLRARQVAPAILFFDELDSLAPLRGGSADSEATERVVNQLLAELDGMQELRGVVVLGATNRPDRIDPALLRPGRFDEIIHVPVPDRDGRADIFRRQAEVMSLDEDVNLDRLAEITERFTGADIAGVCVKAGLLALRESPDARSVSMEHFFRAVSDTLPSVSEEMARAYERLERRVKQESMQIGFRSGGEDAEPET
jgi:transitional endoplasmic reticulum ATPase